MKTISNKDKYIFAAVAMYVGAGLCEIYSTGGQIAFAGVGLMFSLLAAVEKK